MRPTKNRIYCFDSGKNKMLFENEKKANLFIKFNSEEIVSESGHGPVRSYFCISCNGWHVTSKNDVRNIKSRTEKVLDLYYENKKRTAIENKQKSEIRKEKAQTLKNLLEKIESEIIELETANKNRVSNDSIDVLNNVYEELENAKILGITGKKLKSIKDKLTTLSIEIETKNYPK